MSLSKWGGKLHPDPLETSIQWASTLLHAVMKHMHIQQAEPAQTTPKFLGRGTSGE